MKKLAILSVLLFGGCNCSGVKVAATHTVWQDHSPSTIAVEADFDFDRTQTVAHQRPGELGQGHLHRADTCPTSVDRSNGWDPLSSYLDW